MNTQRVAHETEQGKQVHRVVAFLDRAHVDYLDKMGKDALFSTGVKFPRTRVIAAMIDLLQRLNLSGEGIRTEQDLEERLLKLLSGPNSRRLTARTEEDQTHEDATRIRG